jgi:GAF domain-containing protein
MSSFTIDAYHITLILISLITGVLSPIVIQLTRYYISLLKTSKVSKPAEMVNILKLESKIMSKLETIRTLYNADRVGILEFHNGGHTFTGKGFQKFSQTYEVTNKGISLESGNSQNIPTSIFSTILIEVADEGVFKIDNSKVDCSSHTSSFKDFLLNRGVKSFIGIGIRNLDNDFIGVLTLENVLEKHTYSNTEIGDLKIQASILAGYLESILKNEQFKI